MQTISRYQTPQTQNNAIIKLPDMVYPVMFHCSFFASFVLVNKKQKWKSPVGDAA
jgi:hypothetical protein